ncbi:MAG: HpcH/HpaI aldolase family protein [Terrimicrobiaceae bacterium]
MNGKTLKNKLAAGEAVYGTFFQWIHNPAIVEMMPEQCLDFVIVSVEHNALGLADFLGMQFALQTKGIACLARVHSRDPEDVARACDAYPDGVVVPYVEDVEELRGLIAAAKCRPLKGEAQRHLLARGEWPSDKTKAYVADKCANTFFVAMIESVRAVENIDAICSLPGLDAVFIGPNDLTVSMGIPEERDHPVFIEMVGRVIETAARHGIPAGAHFKKASHLERLIAQGARFIPFASDGGWIQDGLSQFAELTCRAPVATADKVV